MIDSAPFRVTRSPKQIEQADPDLLKAYLVCGENTSVINQDSRQAQLSPGEFALSPLAEYRRSARRVKEPAP